MIIRGTPLRPSFFAVTTTPVTRRTTTPLLPPKVRAVEVVFPVPPPPHWQQQQQRRTMGGTTTSTPTGPIRFGPFEVTTQVFLTTPHSFALVNLKPLLPGHVLVCPHAPHQRLTDLSLPEVTDLFDTVRRVQHMLARHYFRPPGGSGGGSDSGAGGPAGARGPVASPHDGSFNIAIQDGADAGQTVPHLHVHVIPRIPGETAKDGTTLGDAIYEDMAGEKGNVGGALWDRRNGVGVNSDDDGDRDGHGSRPRPGGAFARIEDANRMARTMEDMEKEAGLFRRVLASMESEEEQVAR
ncbi:HIT-like domain-containing protein [Microdochium trichocladiopsis]|uniref:Bis(5'-adenosyl)-triphosphatase n=1 Tax=Microdochium trichocladiopsis TaxID=1682393 RepID=A0A9P8YEM1_9PEZI|nr:HIT-like domain-containing protein [Microdochium trichocladiopsis]KAH7035562.1 HIT-like domain-containing protein [Microdochium trichocladiopsis]